MDTALPPLQRYGNRSGDSGVVAHAIVDGAIVVQFTGGDCYLYDAVRPGAAHVHRMQELAAAGRGLGTYITRNVSRRYRAKLPGCGR